MRSLRVIKLHESSEEEDDDTYDTINNLQKFVTKLANLTFESLQDSEVEGWTSFVLYLQRCKNSIYLKITTEQIVGVLRLTYR